MSYIVQSVDVDDAPGLARAMFSAWWENPHWRALWAKDMDLETLINDCAERIPWNLISDRSLKRHLKVVDANSGEIAGYSRYILPESHPGVWHDARITEPSTEERLRYEKNFKQATPNGRMKGMNYEMLSKLGEPLEQAERTVLKKTGPCFAVDYMTTHPAHKGKGVALMMLRQALEQVDAAELKAIVMASAAGRGLYERTGFRLECSVVQDYSEHGVNEPSVHYWLLRDPQRP